MPRAMRRRDEGPVYDAVREELDAMAQRFGPRRLRGATGFERRIAKTVAKWHRMPALDRRAWADQFLADARKRNLRAAMPKAADLPLMYAIVTVCEKELRKREGGGS